MILITLTNIMMVRFTKHVVVLEHKCITAKVLSLAIEYFKTL